MVTDLVSIYPNPAKDAFEITTTSHGNLQLIDLNGTMIFRSTISPGKTRIEVGHLNPGLYTLKFDNQTTMRQTKLIIK